MRKLHAALILNVSREELLLNPSLKILMSLFITRDKCWHFLRTNPLWKLKSNSKVAYVLSNDDFKSVSAADTGFPAGGTEPLGRQPYFAIFCENPQKNKVSLDGPHAFGTVFLGGGENLNSLVDLEVTFFSWFWFRVRMDGMLGGPKVWNWEYDKPSYFES